MVQLYVSHLDSKVERPGKELKGFKRITLQPNETRTVTLPVKAQDLAYWDEHAEPLGGGGGPREVHGGRFFRGCEAGKDSCRDALKGTLMRQTFATCSHTRLHRECDRGPGLRPDRLQRSPSRKQGTATQLIVDGKPFLALTGELGNNTATSLENMQPIWSRLVAGNLNSVLAAVSWAQIEPEEGKYEFALVDGLIQEARRNNLKLVFLWFGSWKNGLSSYAPLLGEEGLQAVPAHPDRGRQEHRNCSARLATPRRDADARAYRALMRHIKEVDGQQHTVLMMQVENEVGVLRDSRDRSEAANAPSPGRCRRN